jgi:hypothetical protein
MSGRDRPRLLPAPGRGRKDPKEAMRLPAQVNEYLRKIEEPKRSTM